MDELRCEIWDFLYRAEGPQPVEAIARHVGRYAETIHSALDHEWFDVTGDVVAIAYRRLRRFSGFQKVSDLADENPLYEHDYLVVVLVRWLERNDFDVAADLEERTKPPTFNGYSPDVYARMMGRTIIGEAEVCERLHDPEIEKRWKTLYAEASLPHSYPPHELHIIVPSVCLDEAERLAAAWGISATFHTEKLADQPGLSGGGE